MPLDSHMVPHGITIAISVTCLTLIFGATASVRSGRGRIRPLLAERTPPQLFEVVGIEGLGRVFRSLAARRGVEQFGVVVRVVEKHAQA